MWPFGLSGFMSLSLLKLTLMSDLLFIQAESINDTHLIQMS
jgi:hypothetical protein